MCTEGPEIQVWKYNKYLLESANNIMANNTINPLVVALIFMFILQKVTLYGLIAILLISTVLLYGIRQIFQSGT